jgi:4-hydroxy-2-oxoheptanedioate aldolase
MFSGIRLGDKPLYKAWPPVPCLYLRSNIVVNQKEISMNKIISQFMAGEKSLGMWLNMSDTQVAEITTFTGFDWICIDLQHGLAETGDLKNLLPIIERGSAAPIIRILGADPDQIGRVLDLGAKGVIVPMINTPEEAGLAAAACRYPPIGNRSCGPTRAMTYDPAYLGNANDEVACIIMIETADGLANVEEIAALEGVDALFVGPVDLSFSITGGLAGLQSAEFLAALEKIVNAANAANIPAGIFSLNPLNAAQHLKNGYQFTNVGADTSLFTAAVTGAYEQLKMALETQTEKFNAAPVR